MNIEQALQIIAKNYPLPKSESKQNEILQEAIELIRSKTNNFQNENGLSSEKIDVSDMLRQNEISASDWLSHISAMSVSEQDIAIEISKFFTDMAKQKSEPQKRIRLAKAKAKSLLILLFLKKK